MVMRIMVAFFLASVSASSVIIGLSVSTFEGKINSNIFKNDLIVSIFLFWPVFATNIQDGCFCVAVNTRFQGFHLFWVPISVFETFLCTLTVNRGLQMRWNFGPFSLYKSGQRLSEILYRDSVIYFIA